MALEEVHLWRGSPEQRAMRTQLVKSAQFAYFDAQLNHPDWSSKTVLDFGGNKGNLLLDPTCTIRHSNYHCLDVIREAIDEGRSMFPQAHFVHYDRHNCSFNPEGVAGLPVPDLGIGFDLILAYSVFTHTTWEETLELIGQLQSRLAPGGALVFTFIDPHWSTDRGSNLAWRLAKSNTDVEITALLERSHNAQWCSLVNGRELYVESNGVWDEDQGCMTYNVYYTEDFLRARFPRATIKRPVNGEMQHCCILEK